MRLHTLVPTQGDSATAIRNPVGDRQQTALLRTVILLFIKIRSRDGQTTLISFPYLDFIVKKKPVKDILWLVLRISLQNQIRVSVLSICCELVCSGQVFTF